MLGLLIGWLPLVQAAETTYTNRSAFDAATINTTTLTFQGLTTSGSATPYASGVTTGGINFQSSSGQLYAIDPAYTPGAGFNFTSGQFLNNNNYNGTSSLDVTLLPAGTTAIGADFGLQTGNTATQFQLTLTLSNLSVLQITLPASNPNPVLSFFGFTSTVPITSVGITVGNVNSGNGSPVVDNFTFGQAIPEPAIGLLLIAGIPLLALKRQRFNG